MVNQLPVGWGGKGPEKSARYYGTEAKDKGVKANPKAGAGENSA